MKTMLITITISIILLKNMVDNKYDTDNVITYENDVDNEDDTNNVNSIDKQC